MDNRVESRILELGKIGAVPGGGVFRGSFTEEQLAAETMVAAWMTDAGLTVRNDAIGNVWGRVEGSEPGALAIVTGSHLDTVANGGNYDGIYGVVAAVEAVERLLSTIGTPRLPIEIVAFTGEEGSRFPIGLLGSKAVAGALADVDLSLVCDEDGVSIAAELDRLGYAAEPVAAAQRRDLGAFIEAHIEQGPVLEAEGVAVGVVSTIVGTERVSVVVRGQADHGGTTPMDMRRDALVASVGMIHALRSATVDVCDAVSTVGRFNAFPGSPNVVPGEVMFSIDARHPDADTLQRLVASMRDECAQIAEAHQVELEWTPIAPSISPAQMAPELQAIIGTVCADASVSSKSILSRAGHDAKVMAGICPTGMLFIPSRAGRSHTPAEYSSSDDMNVGVDILYGVLRELAYEDGLGLIVTGD